MITLAFHGANKAELEREMLIYLGHATAVIEHKEFSNRQTLLRSLVSDLELSVRTSNALKNNGVITLSDLCKMSPAQVGYIPNMGKRSVKEVTQVLIAIGLWAEKGRKS